jgi:hypothetical protein
MNRPSHVCMHGCVISVKGTWDNPDIVVPTLPLALAMQIISKSSHNVTEEASNSFRLSPSLRKQWLTLWLMMEWCYLFGRLSMIHGEHPMTSTWYMYSSQFLLIHFTLLLEEPEMHQWRWSQKVQTWYNMLWPCTYTTCPIIGGAENTVCIKTMWSTNFLCDRSINLLTNK